MQKNIYLMLGLDERASEQEVKNAYARMMQRLIQDDSENEVSRQQIASVREHLSQTWEHIKSPDVRQAVFCKTSSPGGAHEDFCRPKLGQLLIALGLLTITELDSLLEIQHNTKTSHVQIGHLMLAAGYLTEQQLDFCLRLQNTLKLPTDHPQRWGQRLIELGLVDDDQLKVALLEQQMTGCTLRQAFINRGWLSDAILDRIF
jgi:hypothetical protein